MQAYPNRRKSMTISEDIQTLVDEARTLAITARAIQRNVEDLLAVVNCVGCSHAKHVPLRCHEITTKPCGCDLHFGMWPDDPLYPSYIRDVQTDDPTDREYAESSPCNCEDH